MGNFAICQIFPLFKFPSSFSPHNTHISKYLYMSLYLGFWTSLVAQTVKCLPTMRKTGVQFLGWEDPLEKEMAIYSSILAWKIPWTEEPGWLRSRGGKRVRHDLATKQQQTVIRTFHLDGALYWERALKLNMKPINLGWHHLAFVGYGAPVTS